jgi:hypothetical protein
MNSPLRVTWGGCSTYRRCPPICVSRLCVSLECAANEFAVTHDVGRGVCAGVAVVTRYGPNKLNCIAWAFVRQADQAFFCRLSTRATTDSMARWASCTAIKLLGVGAPG